MKVRNREGAPYWANLTEITMLRTVIRHYRPDVTDERLDALTFPELDRLHQGVTPLAGSEAVVR